MVLLLPKISISWSARARAAELGAGDDGEQLSSGAALRCAPNVVETVLLLPDTMKTIIVWLLLRAAKPCRQATISCMHCAASICKT